MTPPMKLSSKFIHSSSQCVKKDFSFIHMYYIVPSGSIFSFVPGTEKNQKKVLESVGGDGGVVCGMKTVRSVRRRRSGVMSIIQICEKKGSTGSEYNCLRLVKMTCPEKII